MAGIFKFYKFPKVQPEHEFTLHIAPPGTNHMIKVETHDPGFFHIVENEVRSLQIAHPNVELYQLNLSKGWRAISPDQEEILAVTESIVDRGVAHGFLLKPEADEAMEQFRMALSPVVTIISSPPFTFRQHNGEWLEANKERLNTLRLKTEDIAALKAAAKPSDIATCQYGVEVGKYSGMGNALVAGSAVFKDYIAAAKGWVSHIPIATSFTTCNKVWLARNKKDLQPLGLTEGDLSELMAMETLEAIQSWLMDLRVRGMKGAGIASSELIMRYVSAAKEWQAAAASTERTT